MENFTDSKIYSNILKIIMIILCIFYFGLLTKLSFGSSSSDKSDNSDNSDNSGNSDPKVSQYLLFRIPTNIEDIAGKINIDDVEQTNMIKVFMIYIIIGLILFLIISNIAKNISNPKLIAKSFSIRSLYESFIVAFVFSLTVLITTSIKNQPNYFYSLVAFILVFCKSQIIRDVKILQKPNLNYILTIILFAIPIIGLIVEKIYYRNSSGSIIESFGSDLIKNSFIAMANTILIHLILNITNRKNKENKTQTNIMESILMIFFQVNLYNYAFNLSTSENGNFF
jgi:hypothetical protein